MRRITNKILIIFLTCFTITGLHAELDENYGNNQEYSDCNNDYVDDCCEDPLFSFPLYSEISLAFDNFRSLPDGSWEGNTGGVIEFNCGMPINLNYSFCPEIGIQLGGSYGIYDWSGRGSGYVTRSKRTQQDKFLTVGVFKRTSNCSGLNLALAYDQLFAKHFGAFGRSISIGQIRFETSYLIHNANELGIWGTIRLNTSTQEYQNLRVKYKAISQINLFWRHYFLTCAETTFWVGLPYQKGLMYRSNRPGKYILGGSFKAPLTNSLSIVGHAAYMRAISAKYEIESRNYATNICIGLCYAFGIRNDEKEYQFRPYLPIANNSNFLVDTNVNY